jgi:hypothetical protein
MIVHDVFVTRKARQHKAEKFIPPSRVKCSDSTGTRNATELDYITGSTLAENYVGLPMEGLVHDPYTAFVEERDAQLTARSRIQALAREIIRFAQDDTKSERAHASF